ncbi:biotin--[acetyl-CoA-carboxylase] ligase [Riemerella columbipharyngis]|uniref:BirA family transcriptional regulator, biotin operon repressor / biotin-[acetyl-CoA-carboxylase] ligase n=1 Tax=Riemerella columbipharyngis TaxID=1071918 RepID=A0A1G6YTN9_9FLAO|nr:biotin--[acetyl-CoA-carboxylase] ligase [Riemerella columbipharyngis]SDD93759.1 BirA family transcriptional regulator, biotin operon repressor / biotin-[acetyl-CoA-carboxylase] ligase [Riemerella columbipharyngis]
MEHLHHIEQCPSTNDEILNFSAEIKNTPIISLYTTNQTAGRGQYGNKWTISPDENLAISFLMADNLFMVSHHLINYYTAIIIREFIANMTQKQPLIKWPNDIILNQKKICGILLEKRGEYLIIGVGINVLQTDFSHFPKAGSIFTQSGIKFNLKNFTETFFSFFKNKILTPPDTDTIINRFNSFLFKKDEVAVFEHQGTRQNGIILNADAEGYIHIKFENGIHKFYHKEIAMLY